MRPIALYMPLGLAFLVSACGASLPEPTASPSPSPIPPSPTATPSPTQTAGPTATPRPTATPVPPTPTPRPITLFLRRRCGRDYEIEANRATEIMYGVWGVVGKELADEWTTAYSVSLTIDGEALEGMLQPPAPEPLAHNCIPARHADVYWLYYAITIPGFSPGRHDITVVFRTSKPLSDGVSYVYGPGEIQRHTFRVLAE